MIDAADQFRIKVAKNELDMLLANQTIMSKEVPLLVYANKADLDTACGADDVCAILELDSVSNRPWSI